MEAIFGVRTDIAVSIVKPQPLPEELPGSVELPVETPIQELEMQSIPQPGTTPEPNHLAPVVEEPKSELVVEEAPRLPTWQETAVEFVLRFVMELLKNLGDRK